MGACRRSPREFKLYVPTRDNSGTKIKEHVLEYFVKRMNRQFGASTVFDAKGCYTPSDKNTDVQCEPVHVMTTVRTDPNCLKARSDANQLFKIADDVAQFFGQDGTFATINDVETMYAQAEKRPQAYPELLF